MTQESCLGWALLLGHELVSLCAHRSSSAPVAPPPSPPPARLLPAACLAGPVPTLPLMTGLSLACCKGRSWAPAPPNLHLSLPSSSQFWAWLATPHSQSRSPFHTEYVSLICLLVELKGQVATKIPAVGLRREPQAKTGHLLRGLEGAWLCPPHQGSL